MDCFPCPRWNSQRRVRQNPRPCGCAGLRGLGPQLLLFRPCMESPLSKDLQERLQEAHAKGRARLRFLVSYCLKP